MVARLLSFLALAALLLMPLVPAPAAAAAMPATMAMNGDGHCGEMDKAADKALPGAHCGAACALLLPEARRSLASFPCSAARPAASRVAALDSLSPQMGTPPPRFA